MFYHVSALFCVFLIIYSMLCIAIRHSSLLALSVQVISMLYLAHFNDLASFVMIFQSIFHAHTLAPITPLML